MRKCTKSFSEIRGLILQRCAETTRPPRLAELMEFCGLTHRLDMVRIYRDIMASPPFQFVVRKEIEQARSRLGKQRPQDATVSTP